MKGKILFVAGLGLGYVLGTRAGREKYDQLKTTALKVWNDPRLQKQVDAAQDFVKDKAPEVAEFVTDGAKTLVEKVSGKSSSPAKKAATVTAPATRKPSSGSASSNSTTKS